MPDEFAEASVSMPQVQSAAIAVETAKPPPAATEPRKKRGRPPGSKNAAKPAAEPKSTIGKPGAQAVSTLGTKNIASRKAGAALAETIIQVCVSVGGEDFKPEVDPAIGQNERDHLREAWADYAEAKQWAELPPGLAVFAATVGYIAPRFRKPKFQTRLGVFRDWVMVKIVTWKMKRQQGKAPVTK